MAESEQLKELVSYMQQKGFVWGPEPEIYNGLAGFYTYAPLGKLLKNNVENAIRKVFQKHDFWEVECPTVMPAPVWKASGHLGGFTDPVISCSRCKANFRVDHLIREKEPDFEPAGKDLLALIHKYNIVCSSCGGAFKDEIKRHSLMMQTTIGLDTEAYNRPETATTTYLPFLRYVDFFRKKIPFGVFQIGKAYRNEISPRQHILRGREFTQAEGQLFILPEQKNNFERFAKIQDNKLPLWDYTAQEKQSQPVLTTLKDALSNKQIKSQAYAWSLHLAYELFLSMGIPDERIRFRQHHPDEKAFYADDAWDIEVKTNTFGWVECCGIHDRTNYDLTEHAKASGKKLEGSFETGKAVPHILEIAFGTDRPTFVLLDVFYEKREKEEGKTLLHLPAHLSPVKAGIFPLVNKEEIISLARKIESDLSKDLIVQYDQSGSVGKRYLRQDEIGTPYCITIDFDSLTKEDVTIRERETSMQKRIKIKDLKKILHSLLLQEVRFTDL